MSLAFKTVGVFSCKICHAWHKCGAFFEKCPGVRIKTKKNKNCFLKRRFRDEICVFGIGLSQEESRQE